VFRRATLALLAWSVITPVVLLVVLIFNAGAAPTVSSSRGGAAHHDHHPHQHGSGAPWVAGAWAQCFAAGSFVYIAAELLSDVFARGAGGAAEQRAAQGALFRRIAPGQRNRGEGGESDGVKLLHGHVLRRDRPGWRDPIPESHHTSALAAEKRPGQSSCHGRGLQLNPRRRRSAGKPVGCGAPFRASTQGVVPQFRYREAFCRRWNSLDQPGRPAHFLRN
jgi:hypothetical protein